jgi:small subunit ribosomal protein S6
LPPAGGLCWSTIEIIDNEVLKEHSMADRQYELVYILPPDSTEEQVAELHTQIDGIVTKQHGQIEKTETWGRRKLAYEIGPHKEGFYVLEVINASGELVKELDRRLKVFDQVLRHLVVRVDEEKKVVDRTRTKRQTESERRRVRRGLPPQRQPGEGRPREAGDDDDDGYSDMDMGPGTDV